jgi:flagellar M-ring protein FliF
MANAQEVSLTSARANGMRPLLLLVGIALAVAAGVAVMLWWQGPNWSLLYGNLSDSDASQVTQALQTAGIKYKLNDASGAIMVPAENVHAARLQLASQGLPGSSNSGIDLISKESGIGVSQFMETARYQYALETELARTVSALKSVEAARVHLAIPQQSAFVRDRRAATASVLVQLRSGARLEAGQVQAIIHLVASSIPELDASAVTVVDQQGHLLSAPESADGSATAAQLQAAARVEDSYVQRIEQLLQPLLGVGRVRAQVTVDLDPASNEQTREQYAPGSAIVRSEQTSEESSSKNGGAGASGVPGALTNQPPAGGTVAAAAAPPGAAAAAGTAAGAAASTAAAATGAATTAATTPESVARQATRNFEIDRTLSYTRQPGGRIKRVTAAVLLDNVRKLGADGKETSQPLAAAQIADITKLVKSAVGFDETRGDNVSVVNAAFRVESQTLTPEAVPIWQRPIVQDGVRMGLGALILLAIALGILRPLIRSLTATPPAPTLMVSADGSVAMGTHGESGSGGGSAPLQFEQQLVQARTLVAQDPKRVAQVVKNWVGEK